MSKFRTKQSKETPKISTSSLPDIIFMLLFFFMVSTTMRETTLFVKIQPPSASAVEKLEKKSLVSFIYIGPPLNPKLGTESRIQLNDMFASLADIKDFVVKEREARDEVDRKMVTTSLKVNYDTKMGVVTDVKQELRNAGAFKINYSTKKKVLSK